VQPVSQDIYYFERKIDKELIEHANHWMTSTQGSRWLSLVSAPGRGNSHLLRNFRSAAGQLRYTLAEAQFIHIDGSVAAEDREPSSLAPIAKAVFEASAQGLHAHLVTLWRNLQRFVSLAVGVAAIIVFAVLEELVKEAQHGLAEREFWRQLIRNIWQNPLKWIELVLVGSILAALYEWITHIVWPGFQARESQEKKKAEERRTLAFSEYGEEFVSGLRTLCGRSRALILTVDNASLLPGDDRRVLEDLFDPPDEDTPLAQFARTHHVLIITVDLEPDEWPISVSSERFKTLPVPAFDELELRSIYQDRYPDRLPKEFEAVRQIASENIGLLFDPPPTREVIREYGKKRKRGSADQFGDSDLMAYWAARDVESVDRGEISQRLEEFRPHLDVLGLRVPKLVEAMLRRFERSRLVRISGRKIHFDTLAVQALRNFLQKSYPDLLAQAHYCWAATLGASAVRSRDEISPASTSPGVTQHLLKQAAWHAAQVGVISNQASASSVLSAMQLTADEQAERRTQIADLLLGAATLYRNEGNIRDSNNLLIDSLDWICGLESATETRLLARTVAELWQNYWLSGDGTIRKRLGDISLKSPSIVHEPQWMVHYRYEELMCSRRSLSPLTALPSPSDLELCNIHALTECLSAIHDRHGFLESGLKDTTIVTPEPVESSAPWFEDSLWQLRIAAANYRFDDKVLKDAIAKWRDRLARSKASVVHLWTQAENLYSLARLWHLVCEIWMTRSLAIDDMEDADKDTARQEAVALCTSLCPTPVEANCPVQESAFRQAELCYQRVLRFAAILQWRPLLAEIDFHFGILLLRHTPEVARSDNPPWWKTWGNLLNACLVKERSLGWTTHAPMIYRARWQFFDTKDRPTSVDDFCKMLQAVRDANYPTPVVLEWQSQTIDYLIDYGHTPEHHRLCAELCEAWARELAALPEALPYRKFEKCLGFEQANALGFAAQALLKAENLSGAMRLVDEADQLLQQAKQGPLAAAEDPKQVRELSTNLRMERAWIVESTEEGKDESRRMFRAIWRDVRDGDFYNPNLLMNLVEAERAENRLGEPWANEARSIHIDPDNPRLSLPAKWFVPPKSVTIANVFEFRFRQLLRMATRSVTPSRKELFTAALSDWPPHIDKFGHTVLKFASVEVEGGHYLRDSRPLMVQALLAVADHFDTVDPDDENELEALRLLVLFEPKRKEYEFFYFQVLYKHMDLWQRELESRSLNEDDWLELARRMDYLFQVLVDSDKQATKQESELRRRGQSQESFRELQEQRKRALEVGRRLLRVSEFNIGLQELQSYLPPETVQFVFLDDLEWLDLWLKIAAHIDPRPTEFGARAKQLRDLACRYVGQFSLTVLEPEAQHLVLELLSTIQMTQNTAAAAH
jgi:hypothetical protein